MSEVAERFATVADGFTARVELLREEEWELPSTCEGWSVRDVVDHVVGNGVHFLGLAGIEVSPNPAVAADPAEAWRRVRDSLGAALEDDSVASIRFDGPTGETTLEEAMERFGIGDVLVHTWDISRATGGDERLDPAAVDRLLLAMRPRVDELRRSGRFGQTPVDAPEGADRQTELLAITGRRA